MGQTEKGNRSSNKLAPQRRQPLGAVAFLHRKGTQMNATNPAPTSQRKPWSKPAWTVRLSLKPFEGNPGVVRATVGGKATDYFLSPPYPPITAQPSDWR
jgi:hypothetical protein